MNDVSLKPSWRLDTQAARALALGAHPDPFAVLGPQNTRDGRVVRAFLPGAVKVDILRRANGCLMASLEPGGEFGLFENLSSRSNALFAAHSLAWCHTRNGGSIFFRAPCRRS